MKPGSLRRPDPAMPLAVLEKSTGKPICTGADMWLYGDGHAAGRTAPDPGSGDILDRRHDLLKLPTGANWAQSRSDD